MNEYKISVIIPVYNAEQYLHRSIDSLIKQSIGFDNIELILVDDCSKDNSREVIEKYAKEYTNIKPVFLKENSGFPGKPRNIGIKNASAEYVMFMDNDDEYHINMCEKLFETLIMENADVVSCNYCNIDKISTMKMNFDYKSDDLIINDDKIICGPKSAPLFDNVLIWNKIFKKEIIENNNIKFYEDRISDDFLFCTEYLLKIDKLVYLKEYYGYLRYLQDTSLSIITNIDKINSSLETCYLIFDLIKNSNFDLENCEYKDEIFKKHIRYAIEHISMLSDTSDKLIGLKSLYDFEKYVSFKSQMNNPFLSIINYFILKKRFKITIFIFNIMDLFRNSNLLRRLYRFASK